VHGSILIGKTRPSYSAHLLSPFVLKLRRLRSFHQAQLALGRICTALLSSSSSSPSLEADKRVGAAAEGVRGNLYTLYALEPIGSSLSFRLITARARRQGEPGSLVRFAYLELSPKIRHRILYNVI
jgi:hypothetical protein